MTVKIGINGFGRMGRLGFRAGWDHPAFDVIHVNETSGDAATAAHLLEFDSVHGRWPRMIEADSAGFSVEGRHVGFSSFATPAEIPWAERGVEIVVEASGAFVTPATLAGHFERGARKVVVAAPVREDALNIVMGVNDHLYDPARHDLVTAASCTTNCLAPVVAALKDTVGIERGTMTTLHDVTNTQRIVDKPHKDLRRARSASESLIPTTTGSARAIGRIFPELDGRLNGLAVRVPLQNASLTDFVFQAPRPVTAEAVNAHLRAAAEGPLAGILGFETRPLVSVDYRDDPRSGIVDAPSTMIIDDRLVKVLAWYDNEWGYANRLMELTAKVAQAL